MPTNWVTPIATDLNKVLDQTTIATCDKNVGPNVQPNQDLNPTAPLRSQALMALAIARVRGAIQTGGRIPVSATLLSVPPEAEEHVLIIAAWSLVAGRQGGMDIVVVGPHGNISAYYNLYQKAEAWVKAAQDGTISPTPPTDPLSSGVISTVDGSIVQPGVKWGDLYGTDAEYIAGTAAGAAPYPMTTD